MKMEVQCLRNGGALMNKDRISELPEALLLQILSWLPRKDVIATSVLSKQWRSLSKMVPKLKYSYGNHKSEHHTFSEIVCRSLLTHKAPVLESLHLVVRDETESSDVGIWMGIAVAFALARHVRKLVVDLDNYDTVPTRFGSVLWSCFNKLDTLKLKNSIILDFLCRVCFSSLRKLHLEDVEFKDEASVSNLFSGCTSLEDLFVDREWNIDVGTFTIAVPSLQRLTVGIRSSYSGGRVGYLIKPIQSYELKKLEKRREMLKQLASEVKSPNSCELVFEYETVSFE